jgi:hypothetical protein
MTNNTEPMAFDGLLMENRGPKRKIVASSDCLFRDMVSRNQHQVATAGNLMHKRYHHVSGNVASLLEASSLCMSFSTRN